MAMYALVKISTSEVKQIVDRDKQFRSGTPPQLKPAKDLKWLPYSKVKPSYDAETQVREGPVELVTSTEVSHTWTVRAKTAQELDDDADNDILDKMRLLKPLVMAINDGSLTVGGNKTNPQLKAILKAHR
jgi:hypothetical protein